jgi:hypothetical protein
MPSMFNGPGDGTLILSVMNITHGTTYEQRVKLPLSVHLGMLEANTLCDDGAAAFSFMQRFMQCIAAVCKRGLDTLMM